MSDRYHACDVCHGVINSKTDAVALFEHQNLELVIAGLESGEYTWDFFGTRPHQFGHWPRLGVAS